LKTSLIIPSYNPVVKLPHTLDALISQREWIDELIVVVDQKNYSEKIKLILESYSDKFNLKIVPQDISGRARSRNKGAEISTNDLLIFMDDDMLAEKGLIEKHIQYHLKTANIIVSGNGYRNPNQANYDFGKFLINMENDWKQQSKAVGEITLKEFNFTACNMSLPKRLFEQLGGFDISFSDGEDFDFAVRAINKDVRIMYDRSLLAWHNDWPEIDNYVKRQNEYTLAKKQILIAHPEYLEHFPNLKVKEGSKLKKFRSSIIRNTIGQWVIAKNGIFEGLPLSLKFQLYRMTISSYSDINRY
jgi:GT2 family glycosyltransferase